MKAEPVKDFNEEIVGYVVECKACGWAHMIYTTGPVQWSFNGDVEKPTFSPSLMVNGDLSNKSVPRCHSFIRDGKWQYLNDCTHDMAGKTVDMVDVE